jgi:ATP-dependent RNA helicase DDX21
MGIVNLFPIQQNCFYPIYNREDIIARDLTGSGKTLAFALPVTEYLRKNNFISARRTQAIVLTPTRELAIQVSKVFTEIKHNPMEYTCATVYGGVSIEEQTQQLRNGCEIFVGTTGRVLDHLNRGNIDFTSIKTVILDEADQMLKLGFKEDIEEILRFVRRQCKEDL